MTNLDARIRERIEWAYEEPHAWGHDMFDALRAVLDVHQPKVTKHRRVRDRSVLCAVCEDSEMQVPYPCGTVTAIAYALGVSDD